MQQRLIPLSAAHIGDAEVAEVAAALRSGPLTTGPRTAQLEREFAALVGAPAAVALNSCTAALHMALVALGIGAGDEVISTTMTFCATVNVIEHVGARPVLVDIEPETLNIDPAAIERAITPRTRAILPMHYAGHPCAMDAIRDLAGRYHLDVIEDAAHALLASDRGRRVGSGANPAAFSFYATKNMTTAEGGMLTGERSLIDRVRVISRHGMSGGVGLDDWQPFAPERSADYVVVFPGYKCNLPDVLAGLGLAQLRQAPSFQQRRRRVVARYQQAFCHQAALELPRERPGVESGWHLYVLRLNLGRLSIGRDAFMAELDGRGVASAVRYVPLHRQPFYRARYQYRPDEFPVAERESQRVLAIPCSHAMSDEECETVIGAVGDILGRFAR